MRRILAALAVLVVAGGCAMGEILGDYGDPVDLRDTDVVGTWQAGTQRSIVFAADGTFTALNLPIAAFADAAPDGFDQVHGQLDGAGTWTVDPPNQGSGPVTSMVQLSFRRLGGADVIVFGPPLAARRQDDTVWLVFDYVSDEGNGWTAYRRCEPACR